MSNKLKSKLKYFKEIFFLLGDRKKKLPGLLLSFFILSFLDIIGIGLIGPYISLLTYNPEEKNYIINLLLENTRYKSVDELLIVIGIIIIVIFFIKSTASILINNKIFIFSNSQVVILRTELIKIYQKMPYTDYTMRNSSEYIQATQVYTTQLIGILIVLCTAACEGIAVISISSLLIYYHGFYPLIAIAFIGSLTYVYTRLISPIIKKAGKLSAINNGYAIKRINESMEGFKEIKILGINNYFTQKVKSSSEIFANQRSKEQIISFIPRQVIEVLVVVLLILVAIGSVYKGNASNIFPMLGMFAAASARLIPASGVFTKGMTTLQFSRYGIGVLYNDFKKYSSNKQETKLISSDKKKESFKNIELKNIFYNYPNSSQNVLSDISFMIKKNQSIGIIGSSGAGKTTLIDIILGLLKPVKGVIKYNDKSLDHSLAIWRHKVAYIPQQIFLVDDTLEKNIALGFDEHMIDKEKIMDAIESSQLISLLKDMPSGINTVLGERGVRLSGGQRQRVALARAFYNNKEVLILDEATSALDAKTENIIVNEIKQLKDKITIVAISHRLSTVRDCDLIYKIENGKIVDFGSPSDVLAKE